MDDLKTKNIGIVVYKDDELTGGGTLLVTVNDVTHPRLPDTTNLKYASFEVSPPDAAAGSVVEFKWKGTPGSSYSAEQLSLYTE